jgi:hypothetical protein
MSGEHSNNPLCDMNRRRVRHASLYTVKKAVNSVRNTLFQVQQPHGASTASHLGIEEISRTSTEQVSVYDWW